MANILSNSKAISRTIFIVSVAALLIIFVAVSFIEYYQVNNLQLSNSKLQTDNQNLQTSNSQLQTSYNQLQSSQSSQSSSSLSQLQSEYDNLQSQYNNLQSQLSNATALIAKLQGPTGILPTYMDLGYVGEQTSGGSYILQLSLKNTGAVPITDVFVTLNSVQITMTFTYLSTTVSASSPLPSYQTATGSQNVTPPITDIGTYPLVIQALATNGTVYTYQTTITSHV